MSISLHRPWHSLMAAFLIPLLAFLLACGPGEEPTSIPTATAVPTTAPAATPTSSLPGPVASPTPTSVATPTPTPSEQPRRGGRLQLTPGDYMPDFDGQVSLSGGGYSTYTGPLYSQLLWNPRYDVTECETCSEWHLENAGKTMVFTLIQGIKFHNGQEMTSADVKWSLRKMMGEVDGISSPRSGVLKEYIESIETPSRYVLRINLVRPSLFVPTLLTITSSLIYPEGTTHADLLREPKGTGPFILRETIPGASWKLDRNSNYFKPGRPYLDGVDIVVVADLATRVANFLTRKTLFISDQTPQYQPTLTKLRDEGKLNFYVSPPYGLAGVQFNHAKPPFSDLKMRQVVNLAMDRTFLGRPLHPAGNERVQLLFFSQDMEYGTLESQIWNVVPGWGTGAKKQQEIEEAKKLMASLYPNGIDIDQMARGPIVGFGHWSGHEPIQQMLREVGIRTTLSVVDSNKHQLRRVNLDFALQQDVLGIPTLDPDEVIGSYWLTGAPRNWTGYSNPEVDRLFIQMSSELDVAKRKKLFLQIQDILILQDVAYAPNQTLSSYVWWWQSLGGFVPGRDGNVHAASGIRRSDLLWLKQ